MPKTTMSYAASRSIYRNTIKAVSAGNSLAALDIAKAEKKCSENCIVNSRLARTYSCQYVQHCEVWKELEKSCHFPSRASLCTY